ncbi:MAG: FecR domain-containing protein [Neptuniibacter sp.]
MKKLFLASLLFLMANLSFATTDSIGTVILSFGQNTALSPDGSQRSLKRKSEIYPEDVLKTGGKGRLQVRFSDGSRLSLKPGTEFKIEQYEFEEGKAEDGKAFYKLIKGGMRTISGQIGKADRDDYKLDAVVATIGIRGTDFSVTKVGDQVSGSVNSGKINVSANEGGNKNISAGRSFSLTGAKGTVVEFKTPPEQNAEGSEEETSESEEQSEEETSEEGSESDEDAESEEEGSDTGSEEAAEEQAETNTSEEADSTAETTTEDGATTDSGETSATNSATETATVDSTSTVTTSNDPAAGTVPASSTTTEGSQEVVIAAPNPTGSGTAVLTGGTALISFLEKDAASVIKESTGTVTADGQSALTIDSTSGKDLLTGILYVDTAGDNCAPCTFESPSTTAGTLNDERTANVGGTDVTWGRWNSGYTVIENGTQVEAKGSFHFIYADQLTSSSQLATVAATKSGQYTYGLNVTTDATSPQIEGGSTGTMIAYDGTYGPSGTYIVVNWDDQTLDTVNLKAQVQDPVTANNRIYTLNKESASNLSLNTVLNGGEVKLSGYCNGDGTACENSSDPNGYEMSGRMSMEFVGDSADGVITSYGATGEDSGGVATSITGSALLKEQ